MFKKILFLILISAMLLGAFASCAPDDAPITETTVATEPEDTEPPAPSTLVFADNGETDFIVVRPEKAQGYYLDTASVVYQKLKTLLSESFKLSEDWINPLEPSPEDRHEILLFSTNRAESIQAAADLTFDGYIIRVTEHKVVIVGSNPTACNEALYHFFDFIIPDHTKDGVTALPIGLEVKKEVDASSIDFAEAMRSGKTVCADFEIVFKYPQKDGFTAAQGSATDGKYAYVIMKDSKSESREIDRVVKIDMATWEVVLESETMTLDHANDMTYDPVNNILIVTNMYENLVSIINPEDLTLIEQKKLPYGSWATGYVDGAGQYAFLAYGTPSGLVITDTSFNPIRSSALASSEGYIGQGMDADANFAYVPLSPNAGKSDNVIQIYDIKTGEYLGNVSVATKMESESMFHVGDDFYMHFNNVGSKIAILEFYISFE